MGVVGRMKEGFLSILLYVGNSIKIINLLTQNAHVFFYPTCYILHHGFLVPSSVFESRLPTIYDQSDSMVLLKPSCNIPG